MMAVPMTETTEKVNMALRRKKTNVTKSTKANAKATPVKKNLDKMIDEKPAHSTNAMREYLRQLLRGGK